MSTESQNGINVGMFDEESVKETGNEDGEGSDQKDTIPQEEEREQSLEMHSDTGMRTLHSSEDYCKYPLYGACGPILYICNSSTEEIKETGVGKACALNGVQEFPNVKKKDVTLKEMKHNSSHGKENISLFKELTHSGSGVRPKSILFAIVTNCTRSLCILSFGSLHIVS